MGSKRRARKLAELGRAGDSEPTSGPRSPTPTTAKLPDDVSELTRG